MSALNASGQTQHRTVQHHGPDEVFVTADEAVSRAVSRAQLLKLKSKVFQPAFTLLVKTEHYFAPSSYSLCFFALKPDMLTCCDSVVLHELELFFALLH